MRKSKTIKMLLFGAGDLGNIGGVQLSYKWLLDFLADKNIEIKFMSHVTTKPRDQFYYSLPNYVEYEAFCLEDTAESKQTVRKITYDYDPDVVLIVNSARNSSLITNALKDTPYPVILSQRGSDNYCLLNLWSCKNQLELTHFNADFSHVLMNSYTKIVPNWMANQLYVIPSLTWPAQNYATPDKADKDGNYHILYVGRATNEKNLSDLIKAFALIKDSFPNWLLNIVGDIEQNDPIFTLVKQKNISNQVLFHGNLVNVNEVYHFYTTCHLFVLPSLAEGCPLALREAMAHGLPVIGFDDCTGTNEIIEHHENGLLAKSNNRPQNLAKAMRELIESPEKRVEFGKQGIIDVKKYNPNTIHKKWEHLIRTAAQYKGRKKILHFKRALRAPIQYIKFLKLSRKVAKLNKQEYIYFYNYTSFDKKILRDNNLNEYLMLYGSPLFQINQYEKNIPEIKTASIDPLLHYLQFGWKLGYSPSTGFDAPFYTTKYMEGDLSVCPLIHYYKIGRLKGYLPNANPSEKLLTMLEIELQRDKRAFGETACLKNRINPDIIFKSPPREWLRLIK